MYFYVLCIFFCVFLHGSVVGSVKNDVSNFPLSTILLRVGYSSIPVSRSEQKGTTLSVLFFFCFRSHSCARRFELLRSTSVRAIPRSTGPRAPSRALSNKNERYLRYCCFFEHISRLEGSNFYISLQF